MIVRTFPALGLLPSGAITALPPAVFDGVTMANKPNAMPPKFFAAPGMPTQRVNHEASDAWSTTMPTPIVLDSETFCR